MLRSRLIKKYFPANYKDCFRDKIYRKPYMSVNELFNLMFSQYPKWIYQYHFPGSCADTCIFRPGKYLAWTALSPKRRSDPVEGNGKSGSEKRGRTWDTFRPEEIHFPDDSGTEEMRRDPAGHDERL